MSRRPTPVSRLFERLRAWRDGAAWTPARAAYAEAEARAARALARCWAVRAAELALRGPARAGTASHVARAVAATVETAWRIEAAQQGLDERKPRSAGRVLH